MLFYPNLLGAGGLVPAVFTYRRMRGDIGGRWNMESDLIGPHRGVSYRGGLCFDSSTDNLGGTDGQIISLV